MSSWTVNKSLYPPQTAPYYCRSEIEVPKDFEIAAEDDADEDDQLASEDTWNDTGLSRFTEENGTSGQ